MLRLVLFPFFFLRMILWRAIWHSVNFLLHRPPLFILVAWIIVGGAIYLGWQALKTHHAHVAVERAAQKAAASAPKTVLTVPPPKVEDGNSRFAINILDKMEQTERQGYSKEFYKAMNTVQPGSEYRWRVNVGVFGSITPNDTFPAATQGLYCRHFSEMLTVHGSAQTFRGIACQRKEGGWCKLLPTSTPVCGFKDPGKWDLMQRDVKQSIDNLFRF